MAANAADSGHGVKTVKVGGISVDVDLDYMRSWDGIRMAARMQSSERTDADRLVDMIGYYERAIPNMGEIDEAMSGRDANEVLALLAEAVKKATPKN